MKNLTFLIPSILMLAVFELILRYLAGAGLYLQKPHNPSIVPHQLLGQAMKPNTRYESAVASFSINEYGFRGHEPTLINKPSNEYRVFALGGSSTFGYYPSITSDSHTYPAQLEDYFKAQRCRVNVVNAGVPGWSTRISAAAFLNKITHFQPDMLIVYHGANDMAQYGRPLHAVDALLDLYSKPRSILDSLFGWSFLYQELRYRSNLLVQSLSGSSFSAGLQPWALDERYLDRFESSTRDLVAMAKRRGIPVLLVKQSFVDPNPDKYTAEEINSMRLNIATPYDARVPRVWQKRLMDRYADRLLDVSTDYENVHFYDADAVVKKNPEHHYDYIHLTDSGARVLATSIGKELSRINLIPEHYCGEVNQ